ncbi:hypothetical protein, partial [Mycobacterium sp. NAZ190054]|uniref:hypothetical protein n=1 Tax=Mycobacterium sp. NAZ190054 TaxID=1747766 RepID=UPI0018D21D8B
MTTWVGVRVSLQRPAWWSPACWSAAPVPRPPRPERRPATTSPGTRPVLATGRPRLLLLVLLGAGRTGRRRVRVVRLGIGVGFGILVRLTDRGVLVTLVALVGLSGVAVVDVPGGIRGVRPVARVRRGRGDGDRRSCGVHRLVERVPVAGIGIG